MKNAILRTYVGLENMKVRSIKSVSNKLKNENGLGTIELLLIVAAIVAIGILFKDKVVIVVGSFLDAFETYMGNQETTTFGAGS